MDLRKIKKLIELVEESGISELEVRNGEESVRIARPAPSAVIAATGGVSADVPPQPPVTPSPVADTQSINVRAPMAGTFYAAPAPDAAPYVAVGSKVQAGDVLCIIESMKMMNEVRAESSGEVVSIVVENGEPVGTGQALFRLA